MLAGLWLVGDRKSAPEREAGAGAVPRSRAALPGDAAGAAPRDTAPTPPGTASLSDPARRDLAAEASLALTVLDGRGEPIEGARAGFGAQDRGPFAWARERSASTDAEGRAELPLAWLTERDGAPTVVVLAEGHAPAREPARLHAGSQVVRLAAGAGAILELLDPEGLTIGGAVSVELADAGASPFAGAARPRLRGGELELSGLPLGETPLVVRAAGYAPRVVNVLAAPAPPRRQVVLRREVPLEVLVRGPSGFPLAGALAELSGLDGEGTAHLWSRVWLDGGTGDDAGRLRLCGWDGERPATLSVRAPHCRPARIELGAQTRAGELVTIDLAAAGELEVEVLDGGGRPVRAAVLLVDLARSSLDTRLSQGIVAEERTAPDGLARLGELPVGVPLGIRVQSGSGPNAEIWTTRRIEALAAGETRRVAVPLPDALRVEGTLSLAGRPMAGALHLAHRVEGLRHDGTQVPVAADGRFEVWLARGSYRLTASAAGLLLERDLELVGPTHLELALGPARDLLGTLVDGRGSPLAARTLCVTGPKGDPLALAETCCHGAFRFEALPAGPVDLSVRADSIVPIPIARGIEVEDLGRVVLDERRVRGRVHDLASGAPLAVALDVAPLGRSGTRTLASPSSDAEGRFELRLPPGEWELRPRAQGWVGVAVQLRISEADELLEVELPAAPALPYRWMRPEPTRGAGRLSASAEGPGGRWSGAFALNPGRLTQLSLPAGRVALEFLGAGGERWSGTAFVDGTR